MKELTGIWQSDSSSVQRRTKSNKSSAIPIPPDDHRNVLIKAPFLSFVSPPKFPSKYPTEPALTISSIYIERQKSKKISHQKYPEKSHQISHPISHQKYPEISHRTCVDYLKYLYRETKKQTCSVNRFVLTKFTPTYRYNSSKRQAFGWAIGRGVFGGGGCGTLQDWQISHIRENGNQFGNKKYLR